MAVGFGFLPLVAIGISSFLQKWVKKKDSKEVLVIAFSQAGNFSL
jgi:hypothetical protein